MKNKPDRIFLVRADEFAADLCPNSGEFPVIQDFMACAMNEGWYWVTDRRTPNDLEYKLVDTITPPERKLGKSCNKEG